MAIKKVYTLFFLLFSLINPNFLKAHNGYYRCEFGTEKNIPTSQRHSRSMYRNETEGRREIYSVGSDDTGHFALSVGTSNNQWADSYTPSHTSSPNEKTCEVVRSFVRQNHELERRFKQHYEQQIETLISIPDNYNYEEQFLFESFDFSPDGLPPQYIEHLNYQWHNTVCSLQNIMYDSDGSFIGIMDREQSEKAAWVIAQYIKKVEPDRYSQRIKELARKEIDGFRNVVHVDLCDNAGFFDHCWRWARSLDSDRDSSYKIKHNFFNKQLRSLINSCKKGDFSVARMILNDRRRQGPGWFDEEKYYRQCRIMKSLIDDYTRKHEQLEHEQRREQEKQKREQQKQQRIIVIEKQATPDLYSIIECDADILGAHLHEWQCEEHAITFQENKEKREQALKDIQEHGVIYTTKRYTVSDKAHTILADHDINSREFNQCFGMQVQQQLHQEFVTILHETAIITEDPDQRHYISATESLIVNLSDVGRECNQAGFIIKSSSIANFCWSALDYGTAVGRGIGKGVYNCGVNNAHMVMHPVETVENLSKTALFLAVALEDLLAVATIPVSDPSKIAYSKKSICYNQEEQLEKSLARLDQIREVIDYQVEEAQKMSGTELTEAIVANMTETYLNGKVWAAAGTFFQKARTRIPRVAEKIKRGLVPASEGIGATPEGFDLKFAYQSAKEVCKGTVKKAKTSIKNLPKCTKTISHILADKNKIPVLRKMYDNVVKFKGKPVKIRYEHGLGVEIKETMKKSTGRIKTELKGFHHDFENAIEKSGIVKIKNKKIICSKTKAYQADVVFRGKEYLKKTFFPPHWTYEQTAEKVLEAYNCKTIPCKELSKGVWKIKGVTNEGLKIEAILEDVGGFFEMATFYPVRL